MRPVTSRLDVTLRTVTDAANVSPRTAVGIPPSDLDLYGGTGYGSYADGFAINVLGSDEMRVIIGGTQIRRAYDPDSEQP